MTRSKAIEWLFWYHAREGWQRFHERRMMQMYRPFPLERPKPDSWWSVFCNRRNQ